MAVRQALGAARMRLIRQLLTESLLLFVLGGITGFAVLFCARKFLLQFVPESLPRLNDISISWGVLAFAIVVSVAAGTIFGLAPAWLTSRLNLTATLRQEGRGSNGSRQRSRLRHVLVIGELALSLVLMVAAGLLLRSFWDLFKVQLGFNPTRVVAIETSLPNPNDPKTDIYRTATQEAVLLREVLRRNRTIPGVEETAVSDRAAIPLGHSQNDRRAVPLFREGQEVQSSQPPLIDTLIVSPEYFHLLGMTLLRGRLFVDQDVEDTPLIAVINQAAARMYWPAKMGRARIRSASESVCWAVWAVPRPDWTTIVGVIADARTESLADAGIPQIYLDIYQRPAKFLAFYLRGQVDPAAISAQVRTQIQAVDAELPVFRAETLDDVLSSSLSVRRFSMEMVALFAATALLLAGLGIYGTISFLVNEQSREIAIRLALGAQRGNYPQDGFTPGPHSGRRRRRRRPGWRAYCFSSHGRPALRCLALRSLHLRRRNRRAHRRRHRRQLRPCAARHAPRSDHYTPRRMTFGTARDLSSQVVAIPMTSFGMLMNSPDSEFQRISPQKRSGVQECQ